MGPIDPLQFKRDGFSLVKNVFSPDEIADFRKRAYATVEESKRQGLLEYLPPWKKKKAASPVGDLLSKPLFTDLVLDPRLAQIAARVLGAERVTYFGDSNLNIGEGPMGFHKDNVNRDAHGPDWENLPYTVVRMGIYCQDHSQHGGGLKVRVGSHKQLGHTHGKVYFVPVVPGDVVVWYLTTTHAGNAVRLRFAPNLNLVSGLEKRVPGWMKIPEAMERVALFFTYGLPGPHIQNYIDKFLLGRPDFNRSIRNSPLSPEQWAKVAAAKHIDVLKPAPYYGMKPAEAEAAGVA
jgi:hypothetical protein